MRRLLPAIVLLALLGAGPPVAADGALRAEIGGMQFGYLDAPFVLEGSTSSGGVGELRFQWYHEVVGGPVRLTGQDTDRLTVVAESPGEHVFRLHVTDAEGTVAFISRRVWVLDHLATSLEIPLEGDAWFGPEGLVYDEDPALVVGESSGGALLRFRIPAGLPPVMRAWIALHAHGPVSRLDVLRGPAHWDGGALEAGAALCGPGHDGAELSPTGGAGWVWGEVTHLLGGPGPRVFALCRPRSTVSFSSLEAGADVAPRLVLQVTADEPPVARAHVTPSWGTTPLRVRFDGSQSRVERGSIRTYRWYVDGEFAVYGREADWMFEEGGRRVVRLEVTSDVGLTDTSIVGVDVNARPRAVMTGVPRSGHAPLYVRLDARGAYDPDGELVRYEWRFGDGRVERDAEILVGHTYERPGRYTATLWVEDEQGARDQDSLVFTVHEPLPDQDVWTWPDITASRDIDAPDVPHVSDGADSEDSQAASAPDVPLDGAAGNGEAFVAAGDAEPSAVAETGETQRGSGCGAASSATPSVLWLLSLMLIVGLVFTGLRRSQLPRSRWRVASVDSARVNRSP